MTRIGVVLLAILWTHALAAQSERAAPVPRSRAAAAFRWSFLGTVLPMAAGVTVAATVDPSTTSTAAFGVLFWGGALAGPALGYFHGGLSRHGATGIALRSAMFAIAWAIAPTDDFNDGIVPNPELEGAGATAWLLAGLGIAISDAIDIAGVSSRVREHESAAPGVVLEIRPGRVAPNGRLGLLASVRF